MLCLQRFPWARATHGKAAVKLHTLFDLHAQLPDFVTLSHGRYHDMLALDALNYKRGAYYILDRGYMDFRRLYRLHQAGALFVPRAKRDLVYSVRSRLKPCSQSIRSDRLIRLRIYRSRKVYPDTLRIVGYRDP